MKNKTHVIEHPSQLNSLSVMPIVRTSALGRIQIGGNMSKHPRKEQWEQDLNRHYYACGCGTSAKGLIIGILCSCLLSAFNYLQRGWDFGGALSSTLLISIGFAAAGKLIGLLKARNNLRTIITEIQNNWVTEPSPESGTIGCG
ncbi:MAG: hypothetical protein HZA22_03105 [Nitrospirae bacterium]|nr:hypothetical protein [Nitrospirota bacterium]